MTVLTKPVEIETEIAASGPREYLWTADDFERACEAGVFGRDRRLELIHGRVIDRMSESPLHATVAMMIIEALRAVLPSSLLVRGEKPIRIAIDGDPIPDISVVQRLFQKYWNSHPTPEDVALLVEIAVSSQKYELGEKALLYAQAGIGDYWVVLPEIEAIVVHREPSAAGYQSVTRLGSEETLSPLAAPDAAFLVRDLFGPAVGEAAFGVN